MLRAIRKLIPGADAEMRDILKSLHDYIAPRVEVAPYTDNSEMKKSKANGK